MVQKVWKVCKSVFGMQSFLFLSGKRPLDLFSVRGNRKSLTSIDCWWTNGHRREKTIVPNFFDALDILYGLLFVLKFENRIWIVVAWKIFDDDQVWTLMMCGNSDRQKNALRSLIFKSTMARTKLPPRWKCPHLLHHLRTKTYHFGIVRMSTFSRRRQWRTPKIFRIAAEIICNLH